MQLVKLKKFYNNIVGNLNHQNTRRVLKAVAVLSLTCLATQVFAADLLQGSETDLVDTIQKTGKKYVYISEGIVAIASYIATKNMMVFFGIIVISIFFNVLFLVAKVTT